LSLFVDASALVAIIGSEPERHAFEARIDGESLRLTSGLAQWEAALAVARRASTDVAAGFDEVLRYCTSFEIGLVTIGEAETATAVAAYRRYGKGNHPARLNMGDCFAYACAKIHGATLLYKGNDFAKTDLA
jgi:ribonuclease VapC